MRVQIPKEDKVNQISVSGKTVIIDGKQIFTVPVDIYTMNIPRPVGLLTSEAQNYLWVGTGDCCHGHVYVLRGENDFSLCDIKAPGINIYDIMPVQKTNLDTPYPEILMSGFGCSGAGVRLVGEGGTDVVLGTEEFHSLYPPMSSGLKRTVFASSNDSIGLFIPWSDGRRYVDLTEKLVKLGVNISATISLLKSYTIHRNPY